MATPLQDVIAYLQTDGGTSNPRPNFVGHSEITFFIDSTANGDMTGSTIAVDGGFLLT